MSLVYRNPWEVKPLPAPSYEEAVYEKPASIISSKRCLKYVIFQSVTSMTVREQAPPSRR